MNAYLDKSCIFTTRRLCLLVFVVFLACPFASAQLPNFTLTISATDETCPGNGSISFSVSGTDPAATVTYQVFQLPNTTTPIAIPTGNSISGLVAGDYMVIATQTLGPQSNSQTWTETLTDETVALAYTIQGTNVSCGNNGTMTINTFSGTAVSYEIIAGPVIKPLQNSNVFTSLAAGAYQVRVFDACGQGWVITHTLFESTGNFLEWAETDDATLIDCNQMTITNTLSPSLNETLSYPITVTYTVFPPGGGAPVVQTTTMTSGDVSEQEFVTVIPYYSEQVYNYTVSVTDGCGNGYIFENILINKNLLVELRSPPAECGEYMLTFALQHYMPPFTITFTDMPPGFDPTAYNPGHPGPFSADLINYGNSNNGVPYGDYTATITDACGHSKTVSVHLEYRDPEPTPDLEPHNGCNSNISDVKIKVSGYILDTAIIASGPASYSTSYPIDVEPLIDPVLGNLEIPNMNEGTYLIVMTDTCGNTYNYELVVTDPGTPMNWNMLVGCDAGRGSLRISATTGITLQSVLLIDAPAAYTATLPENLSYNINTMFPEIFSIGSLPEGDYTFEVTDSCGYIRQITIPVSGYVPITDDTYTVIRHCGSFDLEVNFTPSVPESVTLSTLWLQRFDPVTNTWGHPQTGAAYNPGDTPNFTNSYQLSIRNGTNYNIAYLGDFRILNRFQVFGNGSTDLYQLCVEEIYQFTVLNEIEITNITKTTCDGVNSNVAITAIGVPPMTYEITSMNGQPFALNNGNNNLFTNLQPAVYNFLVTDQCGNITNELTDVALLPSLVTINQPADIVRCDDADNDARTDFDLAAQTAIVLGTANPANFTVTYHLSTQDAASGDNALPGLYETGTREIFVRMQYNNVPTCFETTSFEVIVNPYPMVNMSLSYGLCLGDSATITADAGFDSYLWSTGETTQSIVADSPGTYTLDITRTSNGVTCSAQYSLNVTESQPPGIRNIQTSDWTNNQNMISVQLEHPGNYSYSLDNANFQAGDTFYGLEPGLYTVYVKDDNGCGTVSQNVYLLAYPKFFTPNGDGYNDFWQIYYASQEPDLKVYIFDRYGKLLTGFGSDSLGWDGKYNGRDLPSTDYWFLVTRQDGTQHRGHFAMKR